MCTDASPLKFRWLHYDSEMVYQQEISLSTSAHGHMQDLTETVINIVAESGVKTGTVNLETRRQLTAADLVAA